MALNETRLALIKVYILYFIPIINYYLISIFYHIFIKKEINIRFSINEVASYYNNLHLKIFDNKKFRSHTNTIRFDSKSKERKIIKLMKNSMYLLILLLYYF